MSTTNLLPDDRRSLGTRLTALQIHQGIEAAEVRTEYGEDEEGAPAPVDEQATLPEEPLNIDLENPLSPTPSNP